MEEILQLQQVCYSYDECTDALRDCTVSIGAGERVAVLGNNGAGKSTFFLLANGVLVPRGGQILLDGQPVGTSNRERNRLRRSVGLVFQEPDVQILAGTVRQEISFGPMNMRLAKDEVAERVDRAMEQLDLTAYRNRAPQYLSGGEKKRVTLADVLAMQPRIMLLDEPTASLDPANAQLLEETLSQLEKQGITLVISTHDVDFAWRWAERVLVFHEGHLVRDAAPEQVFADPELLERCGLKRPLLYQVCEVLNMEPQRTVESFRAAYQQATEENT